MGIAVAVCVLLDAPLVLAAAGVIVVALGLAARSWLGGITGDVLGAAAELSESGALILGVALT
jgi:cobalamin synthase